MPAQGRRPPAGRLGAITPDERKTVISNSPISGQYDETVDRESAYEVLKARALQKTQQENAAQKEEAWTVRVPDNPAPRSRKTTTSTARSSNRQSVAETLAKSVARSVGSSLGRQIVRGLLGSLLGGRR